MLSIVVCTYNRGAILEECLESVALHYKNNFPLELIVVDNNSFDTTASIAEIFTQKHSWYKYVFESDQGLSYARNTGYKSAIYDWVLYLDDDALVHADFFERLEYLFSTDHKCVGGLYLPWYKYGQPKWYRESFGSNRKSYTDLSILKQDEFASGGIFLIKKELLVSHNGFDVNFGMNGETIAYGEEDDLQRRLRQSGFQIAYDPHLKIDHLVPKYKMNVNWFLKSSYNLGKTFLSLKGYPNNKAMGLVAMVIGIGQLLLSSIINLPKLLKKKYYLENYKIDVLKKPLKWFGAFTHNWF